MKKLSILALLTCYPALGGYGGYLLFQTVPSKAGSASTSPYSLLINGTFPAFATTANSGKVFNTTTCGVNGIVCPADLIFAKDSGCSAPYGGWDVIAYSATTGQLTVSVEIPTLFTTRPVKIYGCAGNAVVTTFQGGSRGAAYDNNYLVGLHMEETSGTTLHDSTANANDTIKKATGNPAPTTSGLAGAAQRFAGTANSVNNDYALFSSLTAATATWTAEFWINATSFVNVDSIFEATSSGMPTEFLGFYWFPPGTLRYFNSYNPLTPTPSVLIGAGSFHNVAFVRNLDIMNVYVDGVAGIAASGFGTNTEQFKGLGWDGGAGGINSFNGVIDEVFYSNVARSADYLTARYNNLSSPSTFYTVGAYTLNTTAPPSTTRANSQINLFVF